MRTILYSLLLSTAQFLTAQTATKEQIISDLPELEITEGINLHIISKAVGAAEIILCACIVNGRIFIIVYVHSGFAFHPAGVVSVHSVVAAVIGGNIWLGTQ